MLLFAAFFVVPLLALLDFSTTDLCTGDRTGAAWHAVVQDPAMTAAIRTSLLLALITVTA